MLTGIDFNNEDNLIRILKRDKHTRIEGLCTERLFLNQLIETTFSHYSVGWWFTLKRETYRLVKFCPDVGEINETDLQILDFFKSKGLSTFIVGFDNEEKDFLYIDYSKLPTYRLEEWYRQRVQFPKKRRKLPPLPKESERNAA